MSRFNLVNNILGWITFVVALTTYTLTLEPTVSFWDCGEFISASYRLQICHPPGAPLFLLFGRIFSLFAGSDVTQVAFWVNMVSATTSALCVMFTFWIITHLGKKMVAKGSNELNMQQTLAIAAAGLVGALATTWSDTFWFSAVEAEVYASSSFFTMVTFWAILKWENVATEKGSERWLILIAYLIGLAIGVHLLSILVIPSIVYVYYFRFNKFTRKGFIGASAVAVAAIAIVQFGIIPGMPSLATKFDFFFVNTLGTSFNTGVFFMLLVIVGTFAAAIHYTHTESKASYYAAIALYAIMVVATFSLNPSLSGVIFWGAVTAILYYYVILQKASRGVVNVAILSIAFVIIGYSSYAMVLLRSNANPPINMNAPDNPFSLLSYLNREQYGENPLVYGQYFYAKVVDEKKGAMQYSKGEKGYEEAGEKIERVFDPKDCTIFPRMWADRPDYIQAYRQWENIPEGKKATFGKNIDFLITYQMGFMYWRYFMWNFVGRQNDDQGFGDVTRGNWISGISFIDNMRLGPQDNMPDSIKNNKARNTYFFLPLILGIIGLIYHFKKSKEDAIVITTLFLFTGAFIILYLNFPAHQPRERDYAYVGSYQTFMIWIGIGVLAMADWLSKRMNAMMATGIASVAALAGVPFLMASQNWNDHDRSNRFAALDFASNYLNSCEKNAILFTNGDNDTYPLWYAQNVEGIRTDIRVINLSLLNTDWYANALKTKMYDSEPVPFSMTPDKYKQGTRDYVVFYQNPEIERQYGINQEDYYPLKNIMSFINDDNDPAAKITSGGGDQFSYYPTKKFYIPIDKEHVLKTGAVKPKDAPFIADTMKFAVGNNVLMKADLIVLDILSTTNWERPIYFAITTGSDVYLNMTDYFQLEGLTYKIIPIKNTEPVDPGSYGRINTDILYENLVNKFKWGNIDNPEVYLDETTLRQTRNFRNLFYRLAMKLVTEGNKEKAIKALDHCIKVMPQNTCPYDVFVIRLAEAYFTAGATDKGTNLLKIMTDQAVEKYKYYSRFKGKQLKSVQSELDENAQILMYTQQVAQIHQQEALTKELRTKAESVLGQGALTQPMN
ncbi:MAG: DUF2723 domain-containing protein [Bacteroidota bacterium]|jgi:hypothetical protein